MIDKIDTVIDKVTALHKLAVRINNLELLEQITDLRRELIDMKMEHNTLRNENLDLHGKLRNLEDTIIGNLVFTGVAYFHKDTDEIYCCNCLDGDRILSHLVPIPGNVLKATHKCPRCKNIYNID
jgi:hypothetical protein